MMLKDVDLEYFWEDDDESDAYTCEPLTDEMVAKAEKKLGYKLPASYIALLQNRNGGMPYNCYFRSEEPMLYGYCFVVARVILGIGKKSTSLCGASGNTSLIKRLGYPKIGVAIAYAPQAKEGLVFLDYRECGPEGEPKVVFVERENDFAIKPLADNFEEFISNLVSEEDMDMEDFE